MAEVLNAIPDISSRRSRTPRVKQIAFGNGYKQKYGDGLNSNLEQWDMTFLANGESEKQYLDGFFAANYNTYFLWTNPEPASVQKAYECMSWSITALGAGNYSIAATFDEWAGLL